MGGSAVQKRTDIQGLTTAILLTTTGLFADRRRSLSENIGPLTKVGGLTLFQRAVLTLERAGINQVIVLAGCEEEALRRTLRQGPTVTVPVRWRPIREFPPDDPRTWEALAEDVKGFCLIASVQAVFSKGLIERLCDGLQEGEAALVVYSAADSWRQGNPGNPLVRYEADRLVSLAVSQEQTGGCIAADLLVVSAGRLGTALQPDPSSSSRSSLAAVARPSTSHPIRRILEQAVLDGRVKVVPAQAGSGQWYQDVRDASGVKAAERTLFQSLKGEFEGFVDRHFNRKVSKLFTKLFLALRFSPNVVTVVSTVVGLTAAAGFAVGGYAAGVGAALLFQLAAVIDCCDGEVARLTFAESPLGAWLDITADNVVHMAIFAGIAWGAYTQHGEGHGAWIPLALGAAAILGNACSFWLVRRVQRIRTIRGWNNPVQAAWSNFLLKNVASRDFSVVVLLFALLGKLDWFLWLAAIGSTAFWMILLWVIRPSLGSRG
ncbi:MAG TPA: CDP-alcohol phosphatidyltransferase family protein [Nitrospiraceae bacterium]|jgi:phosphatidylglycerophosphate synthase|nr:CDP-alcohol phosphatidyltransferase family protein [Nitrospiraceae bacterium]